MAVVTTGGSAVTARSSPRVRVARTGLERPRTRPDRVLGDKGYFSHSDRAYLRRRGIRATIPVKVDQRAHRRAKGSAGGRPPVFDQLTYGSGTPWNAVSV